MDGEGAGEGEWELRGHETSVPNNSSTDTVVPAGPPGHHAMRSSTNSYSVDSEALTSSLRNPQS